MADETKMADTERKEEKKEFQLVIGGISIRALSVAGMNTCIAVNAYGSNLLFDVGCSPNWALKADHIFISHGHLDHCGGLPSLLGKRALFRKDLPTVYLPSCNVQDMTIVLEAFQRISFTNVIAQIVGIDHTDTDPVHIKSNLQVCAFRTYHRITSQGYLVSRIQRKLKAELKDHSKEEISALHASGEEITENVQTHEIAFTGDTTIEFLLDDSNEHIRRAKILIMEVTYIPDGSTDCQQARERGHIHLDDIVQHADYFQEIENLVLMHFSAKYSPNFIKSVVEQELPPWLYERTHLVLNKS